MYIENIYEFVQNKLKSGIKTEKYVKVVKIKARPAVIGEEIITKMSDNFVESKYVVKTPGCMVVTNPNGEEYVVSAQSFSERYTKTEEEGIYMPKPLPQEMLILDEDVEFVAPWNEIMKIRKGGALNITKKDEGYIYGIQPREFKETYARYTD